MQRRSIGKLLPAATLLNKVLELMESKAYGTFFVGLRLKFTDRIGTDTELFCLGEFRWAAGLEP